MAQENKANTESRRGGFVAGVGRTFLNLPQWFSLDYFKSSNKSLIDYIKDIFAAQGSDRKESFEEAIARMGTTEEDLKEQTKTYTQHLLILMGAAVVILLYALDLLFSGELFGFILTAVVVGLLSVKGYQYSLWLYQIRIRKLGCTFNEWLAGTIKQGKFR